MGTADVDQSTTQRIAFVVKSLAPEIHIDDQTLAPQYSPEGGPGMDLLRYPSDLREAFRDMTQRRRIEAVAVAQPKNPENGFGQPSRLFEHCVEHRGEIAGR